MNPDTIKTLIQSIGEALTPLADKIGKGGEFIFQLAVKQVSVNAVRSVLLLVILLIILIPFCKFVKWGMSKVKEEDYHSRFYDNEGMSIITWFVGIILGTSILIAICYFIGSVSALLNPQWEAIQIIFRAISPVK